MSARYVNGEVVIGFSDVLDSMDDTSRIELVREAAMHKAVIRDVIDQLVDGTTAEGSYLGSYTDLRAELISRIDDVMYEVVSDLLVQNQRLKAQSAISARWVQDILENRPTRHYPDQPEYIAPPSREMVAAYLAEVKA